MKVTYETPFAEKVAFDYTDQVVASTGCILGNVSNAIGADGKCASSDPAYYEKWINDMD